MIINLGMLSDIAVRIALNIQFLLRRKDALLSFFKGTHLQVAVLATVRGGRGSLSDTSLHTSPHLASTLTLFRRLLHEVLCIDLAIA